MDREPEFDKLKTEDEDIKIWRGTVDENRRRTRETAKQTQSSGRHSAKPKNNGRRGTNQSAAAKGVFGALIYAAEKQDRFTLIPTVVILIAAAFIPLDGWKKLLLYLVPALIAGYDVILDTVQNILNVKFRERENIITLSAAIAFCAGEYPAAAIIFITFKICRIFTNISVDIHWKTIGDIRNVCAGRAHVETPDGVQTVGPEYINIGDIIHVEPGEQIPVDGTVLEGITSLDTSPLTGKSAPRAVSAGCRVWAGAINLTAPITVKATELYEDSTSAYFADIAEAASHRPSKTEQAAKKYAAWLSVIFLAAAVLTAVVPPLAGGEWRVWLCRAAVFCILSGTGALTVSLPLAFFGGIGSAAKRGVLIKGSDCLQLFDNSDTFIFDKTGTITEGQYTVKEVFPVGMDEEELLAVAATAERYSDHPIARALKSVGRIMDEGGEKVLQAQELPGKGISAFIGGKHVYVGNAALLEEHKIKYAVPIRPGAAVHVALDNVYCGHIIVADKIRNGAFEAIDSLRMQGVKNMAMLTGDVLSVARPIANKLNFDMLRAELRPEDKAAAVTYLTENCRENRASVFVGDGVTDAESLKNADIGIAVNAMGSDEAVENADIALLDGEIRKLPETLRLAKLTTRIAAENTGAFAFEKLLLAVLTLCTAFPASAAALIDTAFFAALTLNALRTFMTGKKKK